VNSLTRTRDEACDFINLANENLSPVESLAFCLQTLATDDDLMFAIGGQVREDGSGAVRPRPGAHPPSDWGSCHEASLR